MNSRELKGADSNEIPEGTICNFLAAYETELTLLHLILRDSGLPANPEPAREFSSRDENVMISVRQLD